MSRRIASRIWIDPQDFRDLRRSLLLTRKQTAAALDVTARTVQNWETGGARIPWMAFRLLRLQRGAGLPGKAWEGWTVSGDTLHSPNGRSFTAGELLHLEQVFSMSRLWLQMYTRKSAEEIASKVLPFPERRKQPEEAHKPLEAQPQRIGGNTR